MDDQQRPVEVNEAHEQVRKPKCEHLCACLAAQRPCKHRAGLVSAVQLTTAYGSPYVAACPRRRRLSVARLLDGEYQCA